MDRNLYEAAITGNLNVLNQHLDKVRIQLTPDNNTVLHLASVFGQTNAVNTILRFHAHALLTRANSRGETALHLASRGGHTSIVEQLIEKARELDREEEDIESRPKASQFFVWMVNEEGDTALHEAVRHHHTRVAVMLIEQDTFYSHSSNKYRETPLYLAASRGFVDLVDIILRNCRSPAGPAYGGPYSTTALHGAVICKSYKSSEECIEKILNSEELSLTREVDLYGQTPLHYATHTGCKNKVSKLLSKDESTVYIADNDKNTPLHIAASRGDVSIMRIIMSHRPDSCHMIDKKGRNILHIAVKKEKKDAVEFILKHCPTASSLIVQKDVDGNTPLHLLATTSNFFVKQLVQHTMADKESLNMKMFTPLDLLNYTNNDDWSKLQMDKELRCARVTWEYPNVKKMNATMNGVTTTKEEDDEDLEEEYIPWDPRKIVDTHMIVATLIVTIAFAAGFTLPGGYIQNGDPNEGMSVLSRQTVFKIFMVTDTIALICSISAVVVYSAATDYISREKIERMSRIAGGFVIIAITSMMLAFLTGTYVVLSHSPEIAIATLVIGCISFPVYFGILIKYLWDYLNYNM